MPWEHFTHAADMGVRGVGTTKNEAFEEAAKALVALTTNIEQVSSSSWRRGAGCSPGSKSGSKE